MAEPHHHVQYGQALPSGNAVFDDNHESFGYSDGGFQHDQTQDVNVNFDANNWSLVDPVIAQHHAAQYGNPSLAQHWSSAPTTHTPPQSGAYAPGDMYNPQFSSIAPFQNLNYASPQYAQSLDPALISSAQGLSSSDQPTTRPPPAVSNASAAGQAPLQAIVSKPEIVKAQKPSVSSSVGVQQPAHPAVVIPITLPKAKRSADGKFVTIDLDELASAVASKRLCSFLSVGEIPQDLPITKSVVPQYIPRKSINELRRLAVSDPKLAAKLGKRTPKASKLSLPKVTRPKAAGSAASPETRSTPSESSSEYESSESGSDYESDVEEEVPEPSPLPASRPSEPLQAVRYDTMKAVWLPRNVPAQADQIRSSLKSFWEVVKTIRDRWKSDNDAVKRASEAKKESEIPLLKDRVKSQRSMMEMALRTALEHGHPDIVRLFGENKPLMFLFYQFLAERIGEKEYSSTFVRIAFQLLTQCSTLTANVLDETKLNKALVRFAKNGDDEIKALAQKVIDQATSNSKGKVELAKTAKGGEVKEDEARVKTESPQKLQGSAAAGVKRSLGGDAASNQAPKRVASTSVTPVAGSNSAKTTVPQKKPAAGIAEKSAPAPAANSVNKSKPVTKAPSTNFFSSLSTQKKPATSTNVPVSAKKPASSGASTEKKAAPTPKPAFSFAATMASLNKPQEPEPSTKTEEVKLDETPDEREKRLRKEERRKLRVSWKPDAALVSIRTFHHDPEEELGHDANMVRDVGDINSEGRMFKQHKDAMDLDEDDDDEQPTEQEYREWRAPFAVDFSEMPEDSRTNNFQRFGGAMAPVSPETTAMQQHEANTLVAHYFTSADIPACPKEPSDPYTGVHVETKIGEAPPPLSIYSQRAGASTKPADASTKPTVDVTALLQSLTPLLGQASSAPVQSFTPAVAPVPQMPQNTDQFSALQSIFAQHSNVAQPPPPPPPVPATQTFPAPPQPPATNPQVSALLAAFQAQSQQQTPAPAPSMLFPPAIPPAAAPAQNAPAISDTSALLAHLNPQFLTMLSQAQNVAQPASQQQNNNSNSNSNNNNNNASTTSVYEHPDRKRRREGDDHHENKQRKGKSKYRTVPCAFYKEGKCKKGEDCTYLHEM